MKTAVVLSGGGAKGGFEVGALKRIVETRKPDVYYGTSVGALNAVTMALHGIDRLEQEWRSIRSQDDVITLKFPLALPWSTGLYSMRPLRERIERMVRECGLLGTYVGAPLAEGVVCYCDLSDGSVQYRRVTESLDTMASWTEASACIPVAMELVDDRYADGGLREQTPLRIAIDEGADEIVVVLCNPLTTNLAGVWCPTFPKLLSTAMRAADVMSHEIFLNDMKVCRMKNRVAGYRQIDLKVISPSMPLADTLDFSPERITSDMSYGYYQARAII